MYSWPDFYDNIFESNYIQTHFQNFIHKLYFSNISPSN